MHGCTCFSAAAVFKEDSKFPRTPAERYDNNKLGTIDTAQSLVNEDSNTGIPVLDLTSRNE